MTEEIASDDSESMDDTIAAALADIKARGEPVDEPEQKAEPEQQAEKPQAARDEHGRFAKKEEPKPEPEQTAQPVEQPQEVKTEPKRVPKWNKSALEHFEKLPPEVQAAALKREEDIHAGISQYKEAATLGSEVRQALGHRAQLLAQQYGSVGKGLDQLLQVSEFVDKNPEQFIRLLAQRRGLDLAKLAEPQTEQSALPNLTAHPEFQRVAQQAQTAQQLLAQLQREREQQEMSQAERIAMQFAAEHDKHGFLNDSIDGPNGPQPGPFSQTVMSVLQTPQAQRLPPHERMAYAYKIATQIDPHARAVMDAEQQKAQAAAREKAEAIERAKRSQAVNIRQRGTLPAAESVGSMEDTIREAYRRLTA